MSEQNQHQLRAFLLNKKEDYERDLKVSDDDGWKRN